MKNKLPYEAIKRKVVTNKKSKTSKEYGMHPEKRDIKELIEHGIININKPEGPTSHEVSSYVQKILEIKKSGHSGTLDPKVTGVLPVALSKATRIVQTLLKEGKEYVALMHLHKEVPQSKIHKVMREFTGKIQQMPPIKSAVKRQLRIREIYYIEIMEIKEKDVLFRVGCEAGTYIRKLIHDIGQKLNVGAHMAQLVRTKVGPFNDKNWHALQDLKDAYEFYKEGKEEELRNIVMPVEFSVQHLPKIWVLDTTVDALCHGADLYSNGISKLNDNIDENSQIAVLTLKDELVCLGESILNNEDMLKENKRAVKTTKVFMEIGEYPKFIKKETKNNI
ncbi:MAG: RNA-guided pseudouridylation complex pseudouridine synthase subunit Cbf5 [Candidatus Nanoarchaeia archaeon]|jgi:H/ACA ribonucleoprotein complex subunit 4|nr:RNA-guided pseudouridylation complex pseudouridine synthase subunit Cbf5 [Candidatus Nanoarchaeia archaeon]|tara:strand:- start:22788 stop:23792 length:1005 start_codon:yes stop_codon:yes gene_type:complete